MSENTTAGEIEVQTVSADTLTQAVQNLNHGVSNLASSFAGDSRENLVAVGKAISTATPLDEIRDKNITVANYVVQPIELADEQTGELRAVPRVILITDEGKAYYAISVGVFSALQNMVSLFGVPSESEHWPLTFIPKEEKTRKGFKVLTLALQG